MWGGGGTACQGPSRRWVCGLGGGWHAPPHHTGGLQNSRQRATEQWQGNTTPKKRSNGRIPHPSSDPAGSPPGDHAGQLHHEKGEPHQRQPALDDGGAAPREEALGEVGEHGRGDGGLDDKLREGAGGAGGGAGVGRGLGAAWAGAGLGPRWSGSDRPTAPPLLLRRLGCPSPKSDSAAKPARWVGIHGARRMR